MIDMDRMLSLRGRRAVMTGGAGHIGAAIADAITQLGADVVLVDRDTSSLDRIATSLRGRSVTVEKYGCDLEDRDARAVLIDRLKSSGPVDMLINNAAFVGSSELQGWVVDFESQSIEVWRRAFEVNLTAAFELTQALSDQLARAGEGSVINIGSIYGVVGPDMGLYEGTSMGNPAAYAASKGGLLQLTRWLATVMGPKVRVNCISPGGISRGQPEKFVERYCAKTPLGRMGTEEDMVGAVIYLASDMSRYVTGQNIVVDGGFTSW